MSALSDAVIGTVSTVINRILPDQAAKDAAALQLATLNQTGELARMANDANLTLANLSSTTDLAKGQLDIDKTEAAQDNVFDSGWRPAVGWVCVLGLLYAFIVSPIGTWVASLAGHPLAMPALDIGTLLTLLLGLLGLGSLRTVEKVKGVA